MAAYDMKADYDAFVALLPSLVEKDRGRFALVHDRKVVAVTTSMEVAIGRGAKDFGMEHFIAQEITDVEPRVLSYSMLV